MPEQTDRQTMREKVKLYLDQNIFSCVTTKAGSYYHGHVNSIKDDLFMFVDRFVGIIPFFYAEVESIEPSRQVAKKEGS